MPTTLYRPVGLYELALIWDSGCHEFPPRLPEQPIFYPVTSREYAIQIARDWNTKSPSFAGYVSSFDVDDAYLADFERHIVGSAAHEEYWIPAEQVPSFNRAISGEIRVESAFFGESFVGFVPEKGGFHRRNAREQFVILARSRDYSRMDFTSEISLNRKAVYLNCSFWPVSDFSDLGISYEGKRQTLTEIIEVWKQNKIEPLLPASFLNSAC
jgi:hypothetical protein